MDAGIKFSDVWKALKLLTCTETSPSPSRKGWCFSEWPHLLAEPNWTLWLWPRPRSLPSFETSAAPIYMLISIELETVEVCDNVALQWRIQGWRVATEACDTPGARLSYRDSALRIGLPGLLERYVQAFGVVHTSDDV